MIFQISNNWFAGKINLLNSSLAESEKLQKRDLNFETDSAPAALKDNSYLLKLKEFRLNDDESKTIKALITVEFCFRLYKKLNENYRKLIDEKLYELTRLLNDDADSGLEYTENSFTIANIYNISITGLNKSYKGGEYLTPVLEFELQIINETQ